MGGDVVVAVSRGVNATACLFDYSLHQPDQWEASSVCCSLTGC